MVAHDLSHGFGLPHDFRNDVNFAGNLMGNGFRGFRGWAHPEEYPDEGARTGCATALALSVSRYFNNGQGFNENVKPSVNLVTSGAAVPMAGHLVVRFTAGDASGLACAFLHKEGELVGEMTLSGTSVDRTFRTPWYDAGVSRSYTVSVIDTQCNRSDASGVITVATGQNRAPRPSVTVQPHAAGVGEEVEIGAANSADPDGNPMTVEWDLDGDGAWDTPPSSTMTLVRSFSTPGIRLIRCRVSDSGGASSISAPVAIRITGAAASADAHWSLFE